MADTLEDLAARCESATGPDRELDWHLFAALGHTPYRMGVMTVWRDAVGREFPATSNSVPEFTASLDAAMTLVPEGYDWIIGRTNGGLTAHAEVGGRGDEFMRFAATPALALCAAALRAIAKERG